MQDSATQTKGHAVQTLAGRTEIENGRHTGLTATVWEDIRSIKCSPTRTDRQQTEISVMQIRRPWSHPTVERYKNIPVCQSKQSKGQQLPAALTYRQVATQCSFHMLNHTVLTAGLIKCKAQYCHYVFRLLSVRYQTEEVGHGPDVPFQGGRKAQRGGNKHKKTWIPTFPELASKRQPSRFQTVLHSWSEIYH